MRKNVYAEFKPKFFDQGTFRYCYSGTIKDLDGDEITTNDFPSGECVVKVYKNGSFTQDYLAVSFKTNEIAYLDLKDIFLNLKNEKFEINFNIICDGFHNGPITCMDVALQRPIIVTTSQKDKSIRLWNYLTVWHFQLFSKHSDVQHRSSFRSESFLPTGRS